MLNLLVGTFCLVIGIKDITMERYFWGYLNVGLGIFNLMFFLKG